MISFFVEPFTSTSPRCSAVENKNGRWHGKTMHNARFAWVGYVVVDVVRSASYEGFHKIFFADTPMQIMKCVGSDAGLVLEP